MFQRGEGCVVLHMGVPFCREACVYFSSLHGPLSTVQYLRAGRSPALEDLLMVQHAQTHALRLCKHILELGSKLLLIMHARAMSILYR